jgi:hypothetical protein
MIGPTSPDDPGLPKKNLIALLDPHYDELWVGGKASYKLGAVVEDGGELFIFAPHLSKLSTLIVNDAGRDLYKVT